MKKRIALLLTMSLLTASFLSGCTQPTAAQTESASEATSTADGETSAASDVIATGLPKENLTFATGSSGGTYYALGGAMATSWTDTLDSITVSAISTGASTENMNLINNGEADLAISMNSIADECWNGTGAFSETGPQQNFYSIGVVYPEVFQIVAAASLGASSLSDLEGKTVAIGPVGSGTASAAEVVFSAAGMDISSDIKAQRDSFSDATTKMQDGLLDASCAVLAVPASAITELETSKAITFIEISDEELANIQASYPYYTRFVIPAGTYSNEEDVNTVTCQAALYCRADLDEDTVYYLTKAFYEQGEAIAAVHTAGQYISLDNALNGITTPLHPGAVRYYEEMGITVPDDLMP